MHVFRGEHTELEVKESWSSLCRGEDKSEEGKEKGRKERGREEVEANCSGRAE